MPRAAARFLAAFADDLVALEMDGGDSAELRARTASWVVARIAGASSVTRFALVAAATLVAAAVTVAGGGPYERLDEAPRRRLASRLAATGLPGLADFVKAVRALAVSYAYDARHMSAP